MCSTSCLAGRLVHLSVSIIDPSPIGHQTHKSPVCPPSVFIEDYTLSFNAFDDDVVIQLLDGDDVIVFSGVIPAGTTNFQLPSTLEGEYQIQLIYGNFIFTGYVEI